MRGCCRGDLAASCSDRLGRATPMSSSTPGYSAPIGRLSTLCSASATKSYVSGHITSTRRRLCSSSSSRRSLAFRCRPPEGRSRRALAACSLHSIALVPPRSPRGPILLKQFICCCAHASARARAHRLGGRRLRRLLLAEVKRLCCFPFHGRSHAAAVRAGRVGASAGRQCRRRHLAVIAPVRSATRSRRSFIPLSLARASRSSRASASTTRRGVSACLRPTTA